MEKLTLQQLINQTGEAYNSPSSDELPAWKKDKDLLDWLKSL